MIENRRSIRHPGHDYSRNGAYFVTLCTRNKSRLFGEVHEDAIRLNPLGMMVAEEWRRSAEIRTEISLDEFVVMPNHLHGIVWIRAGNIAGAIALTTDTPTTFQPWHSRPQGAAPRSLGAMVTGFKAACTRHAGFALWQRNYHERIIRDEDELMHTRGYIRLNPHQWGDDEYFK